MPPQKRALLNFNKVRITRADHSLRVSEIVHVNRNSTAINEYEVLVSDHSEIARLCSIKFNVAEECTLEDECLPLHGKIDKWCGEERNRHLPARFLDVYTVDLIRPAPKMECDRSYVRAVAVNFGKFAIDVIADPNRQISVHDQQRGGNDDQQPKPPVFD